MLQQSLVPFAPRLRWISVQIPTKISIAVILFLLLAAMYAVSGDQAYSYDGVVFANTVEIPLTAMSADIALEWNHFLWYPTGRAFYLVLHALGIPIRGYQALQLLNALVGAAGIVVIFLTLSRLVNPWWALGWSLVAAFCASYWARSAAAENYLFGTFWAICVAHRLVLYWQEPSDKHMVLMSVFGLLSAYYHLGNLAIAGIVPAVVVIRQFRQKEMIPQFVKSTILLVSLWIPYAEVHHWFEPGGFSRWLLWSSGLADGFTARTGAFESTVVGNIRTTIATFLKSVVLLESWNALLGTLILVGTAGIAYAHHRAGSPNRTSYVLLIPFLATFALYAIWQPWNPIYWCLQTSLFCMFAGAFELRGRLAATTLGVIVGLLAIHNLRAGVLPNQTNPRQLVVDASIKIGQMIPPASPVIISGRSGDWGYLKVYLPYFAKRNRLAIDLFAINGVARGRDPIAWMQEIIRFNVEHEIPVFITEDALKSTDGFRDLELSPQQIESIWKSYKVEPIADLPGNPSNKIYWIVPNSGPTIRQH